MRHADRGKAGHRQTKTGWGCMRHVDRQREIQAVGRTTKGWGIMRHFDRGKDRLSDGSEKDGVV